MVKEITAEMKPIVPPAITKIAAMCCLPVLHLKGLVKIRREYGDC